MENPAPFVLVSVLAFVVACGDGAGNSRTTSDPLCASGTRWSAGDRQSPDMHPGLDCIGCHTRKGEGPRFGAAGTVYLDYSEPDDCFGVDGYRVEITDADGVVHTATTRESGNFSIDRNFPTPYTARIVAPDGSEVAMATPQTVTDCNSCHTPEGQSAAAGRMVVP